MIGAELAKRMTMFLKGKTGEKKKEKKNHLPMKMIGTELAKRIATKLSK